MKEKIYGILKDENSRCVHYHSEKDIIAIKFKCCNKFYACYECHQECEDHEIETWNKEMFDEKTVLCGNCNTPYSFNEYKILATCSNCNATFNEKCSNHYHFYFKN